MTKNKEDLDPFVSAFVDSTLKGMQASVRKNEEICPQIILFAQKNEGRVIIPLIGVEKFFTSMEGKRHLRSVVRKSWNEILSSKPGLKLIAVVLVSDAWVEVHPLEEGLEIIRSGRYVPLSEKPGMAEAVIIQVGLADRDIIFQWPYVRSEESVVFAAEPRKMESPIGEVKALFGGMWPL